MAVRAVKGDTAVRSQVRDVAAEPEAGRSCRTRSRRGYAGRVSALVVAAALLAASCGGGAEPTLTAQRPQPPARSGTPSTAVVSQEPSAPSSAASPAPEPTVPPATEVTPPPAREVTPPLAPEVTVPPATEVTVPLAPEVTVSPATEPTVPTTPTEAPPPAPAPPVTPPAAPPWQPVTVLIARDDVNGVIPVYDAPDGSRLSFPDGELWSYTFRGNRLVVRVTQGSQGDEWVQAELPVRPSGVRGWIRTENFDWSTHNHHVLVDVSDRRVTLFDGDTAVVSTRAIVGKSSTPTPALRGFIVEKLPNHNQQNASVVLGDWVLMLSFFSEALSSFGGGLPRIALHGTHIPGSVGQALSNGCIRIPNNIIETIARRAPLGTVVDVVA